MPLFLMLSGMAGYSPDTGLARSAGGIVNPEEGGRFAGSFVSIVLFTILVPDPLNGSLKKKGIVTVLG
jgi:hypothetical protein